MNARILSIITIILSTKMSKCHGRYLNNEEASRRIIFNINSHPEERSGLVQSFLQNNRVENDIRQILVGLSQTQDLPSGGATMSFNRMGFELREIIRNKRKKAEEKRMLLNARRLNSNSR